MKVKEVSFYKDKEFDASEVRILFDNNRNHQIKIKNGISKNQLIAMLSDFADQIKNDESLN